MENKKQLLEVEYKDIFKPETLATLKGKSGESLRQMLGNKTLMQTLLRSKELLDKIIEAEEDYHIELSLIAEIMAREAYPIIDYANIKIDAKIVTEGDLQLPPPSNDEEPVEEADVPMEKKRRIINGITQGASVRGTFVFLLFREHLDEINQELIDNYNEIMKLVFGIYDDENAIAMMLAALSEGQQMAGGSSEMVYDENKDRFIIKARALCFPMLFHEIVKGLYEIIGTEGFSSDNEKNKEIIDKVDKVSNEPHDFQYGKFIYDGISKLYSDNNINDDRVRELFFAEVYKLEDDEFFPFIENVINNKLTNEQKRWASDTMKEIKSDLTKDDTGLEDLDENEDNTPKEKWNLFKATLKSTGESIYSASYKSKSEESWFNTNLARAKFLTREKLSASEKATLDHPDINDWDIKILIKNETDKDKVQKELTKAIDNDPKALNSVKYSIPKEKADVEKIYISNKFFIPSKITPNELYVDSSVLYNYKKIKTDSKKSIKYNGKQYYLVLNPRSIVRTV